ncbi:MAG TPA: NUDIX domain-containing protein [Chitinophagaceae bacterium]|jgi:8-oxo-dGTP pyrophosphatase MutT (NUDIX family)
MARKVIAAGGLVTNNKNELLIIFRRGKWDLPKGKLDEGETIEECALREVREETGIGNLKLVNLVGITYHEYFEKKLNEDILKETHWFSMHVNGEPKLNPQTEEDIENIIWADENELKKCLKNTYKNIIEIIRQFKQQQSG